MVVISRKCEQIANYPDCNDMMVAGSVHVTICDDQKCFMPLLRPS